LPPVLCSCQDVLARVVGGVVVTVVPPPPVLPVVLTVAPVVVLMLPLVPLPSPHAARTTRPMETAAMRSAFAAPCRLMLFRFGMIGSQLGRRGVVRVMSNSPSMTWMETGRLSSLQLHNGLCDDFGENASSGRRAAGAPPKIHQSVSRWR
jgi:hypothetical protein